MAVSIFITFDLVTDDYAGNIRLIAANGNEVPTGDFKIYWGITGPDGVEHKTFPSTPDDSFASTSAETFVRIPKDSSGAYLNGDYLVRILMTDSDDPVVTFVNATLTVPFQPYNSGTNADTDVAIDFDADYNCDTGNITALVTVGTQYTDSFSSEQIVVTPETATGETTTTVSGNEISAGAAIFYSTNADYVVTYSGRIQWEFAVDSFDTITVMEDIVFSETLNVQCTLPDLCKVASCLEKEFKILEAKICGKGWESLTEKEKGKFNKAAAIARLILLYKGCGNDTKYREYVTDFETLMDCSCGCGDDATTLNDPIPYNAPNLFID